MMMFREIAPLFLAVAIIATPIELFAHDAQTPPNEESPAVTLCTQSCRNDIGESIHLLFQNKANNEKQKRHPKKDTKIETVEEMGLDRAEQIVAGSAYIYTPKPEPSEYA